MGVRDTDWGERPSTQIRPASKPLPQVPAPPPRPGLAARIKRLWLLWVAMALLGAIAGAVVGPRLLDRKATPPRLQSKDPAAQPRPPADGRLFENESVRIQFRKPERRQEAGEGPATPSEPDGPMH